MVTNTITAVSNFCVLQFCFDFSSFMLYNNYCQLQGFMK